LRDTNNKGFDGGVLLGDYKPMISFLYQSREREFSTGIRILDNCNIVPARGTLMAFLGPVGSGKTWFLIHLGRQAAKLGKKVLYVSLELSEVKTQIRYYQTVLKLAALESPPHHPNEDVAA
jgi:DNA replication protein DnaC